MVFSIYNLTDTPIEASSSSHDVAALVLHPRKSTTLRLPKFHAKHVNLHNAVKGAALDQDVKTFQVSLPGHWEKRGASWIDLKVVEDCPWRVYWFWPAKSMVVLSKRNMASYLSELPDTLSLAGLVLPGTHDTMAFYGWPVSQCQSRSTPLSTQFLDGVRVIDVRLAAVPILPAPGPKTAGASPQTLPLPQFKLIAYHGIYPQRTPFATILASLHTFLTSPAGARETIVMSIKQEDFTVTPPTTFSRLVKEEIMNSPGGFKDTNEKGERDLGMWYLQNRVPNLGEVRGKVVLLSRFGVNGEEWEGGWEGLGIHPLHWPDSEKKGFVWHLKGTAIRTHDWYAIPSFLAIPEKTTLSTLVLKPSVPFPLNLPLTPEPSSNGEGGGSSAPAYGPETLNIAYLSAATFPLALPPTVAMGMGFPGWKMGFEGVNARVGRWLLEELVPDFKSFSPIKSAAAPKSVENGYGAVKQSPPQDKEGVLMEESADEKRAARLSADDDNLIQNLLKSNESPTEEQRAHIRAKVQRLEEEFLNKAGRAFADDLVEEAVPRRAKSCHEAVLSHRALLSCIRSVPEEVWQRIFFFEVVDEAENTHNIDSLRKICAVSRRWRSAAIKHCCLWTKIPKIFPIDPNTKTLPCLIEDLERYLSRSGALPISVKCIIVSDVYVAQRSHVEKILRLLTDQSHRWQDIRIQLPLPEMKMLSPIQDRLPMLTKLYFSVGATDSESPEEQPREIKISYFSNAPMLRDVRIVTRNAIPLMDIEEEPAFRIDIPWSQLEAFEDEARCTTSYHDLIEAQPVNLKTLDFTAGLISELPSTPCTLPNLTKVHLKVGNIGNLVASHLDLLTLPALTDLAIRGRFLSSDPLYTKVLALIRRSGCSLKRLELDPVIAEPSVFSNIFLLSPSIETLDITNPDTSTLNNLILDTSSPSPVLPKLKSLTIRNSEMDFQIVVFDAPTLMRMIKSRTEELAEGNFDKDLIQLLEDVSFVFDNDETFHLHTVLFEMEDTATYEGARHRDTSLGELASRSRRILRDELTCYWHPRRSYLNLKLHLRYNKLLSRLEKVDVAKHNSQVLMVSSLRAIRP
ncbi:hypothetical protein EST38_g6010 [Candolleomyces aberdarensis]|uniref:F-box domain-containing protein n=1 Tax=Candolleomyces aberdarensis TaxID=2316362 RepID=A0A4Q2DJ60_9AGAR|nr:hypothetical protein EST38_g6010 [Candolleomyces aberdarensis]